MKGRKEPFKVKATSWTNHRNEKFTQVAEYYRDGLTIFYDVENEKK